MSATEVMERYVAAVRAGDFDAAFGMFADDIVFRIPGRSPHAGEHRGKAAAMAYIDAARAASHGADVSVEVRDALTSAERFALIVEERFARDGEVTRINRANVYRVAGEQIVEVAIYEGDQYEMDALMGGA